MINFVGMGRRFAQLASGLLMSGLLVACGGGGGAAGDPVLGGNPGTGTTPTTLVDLSVVTDRASVNNTGTETVTVTVTALAAGNAALTGTAVPITLAVDSGAVITAASKTTDTTTGKLTATVTLTDKTNRTIKVTASSGNITKTTTFDVVDSVTGSKVADLAITLDRTSIPNNGTQAVRATVTTLDASRNAIGGSAVSFKVIDSGDAFVNTGGRTTTDPSTGQISADISLGSNHTNRTIQVVATSGTVQRAVTFDVIDPVVNIPKASDLSIVLNKTEIGNSGSESVVATVTAVDASRNVIAGIPVSFTVDNNAIITASAAQTNAQGQVTGTIVIGSDRSERLVTVTAKSETLTRSAIFKVGGVSIQATALPQQPAPGSTNNKVEFRVVDINQNAMVDVPVTVTASGGITGASARTDSNGAYTFSYTAPTTPNDYTITAAAAGDSNSVKVTVPSGNTSVPPVTLPIKSATLTATPSVVRVNTSGSTTNRSELRAKFLTDANKPVANVRVRFDYGSDPNSVGGSFTSGTNIVYSDADGFAIASYAPDTRASPTDGVTIRACYDTVDFPVNTCPNGVVTTALTVVSDPLSITIGTDDTIESGAGGLTYIKKYVLLVVDSAGNPKSDVQISTLIDLEAYDKGYYFWSGTAWIKSLDWETTNNTKVYNSCDPAPSTQCYQEAQMRCMAEDLNRNGVPDGDEDRNHNNQLDPRKSDVSISMVGSTKTDSSGVAVLKIEYPKSLGSWVHFKISAAASGVLSPPAYYSGILPVLAASLKTETPTPAFVVSPYGKIRLKPVAGDEGYCTNAN